MASTPLSLFFSSHSMLTLCSICSALLLSIYRQEWRHQLQLFFNKGGCQPLTSWMGAHGWCNSSCRLLTMATSPRVGLLPHKWQYPNNHPLCHLCGATVRLLLQHRLASVTLPSLPFWERLRSSLQVLATPFNHQSHQSTPFITQKADHYNQMVCHITSEEC